MIRLDSIMERDIITARQSAPLKTIVDLLEKHRIGAVIIVSDTREVPVGVVTERDIVYALGRYHTSILEKQAKDIMSSPLLALPPEESVETAEEMMAAKRIRRVPVVREGALLGIVTHKDIISALEKSNALLEIQNEALKEKANHDDLTGLYNKGYIMNQLDYHMALAKRSGNSMALLFIDIDHFKEINDTHGHLCGDEVLRQLAKILQSRSRAVNIVGRYGGEEFVIIGPISNYKSTVYMADRLRSVVEQTTFLCDEQEIELTISIGVCIWNSCFKVKEEMIKVADDALYRAKAEGRNRVVIGEAKVDLCLPIISIS